MNKTYKLSALWMMCLMLLGCLSFSACNDGDEEDTNQYKGGISLNVYGPQPVVRGGVLRFLGSGMNQVQAVVIPGCSEITEIEVVSEREIRVTVPQTAEPGYVVLKTPAGDITTKTKLTYSEPISVDEGGITPNPVKPGEVLTIKGEYLNLIKEVVFFEEIPVGEADFIAHSREEIQVRVPMEAKSGDVTLADAASEDEEAMRNLIVVKGLEILLPSVEATQDITGRKPGDIIIVKGTDLDLVEKVKMPNGDEVEFTYEPAFAETKTEVEVGEGQEKIIFTLPDNASDGVVVMIPASGVEVAIATIGMALPEKVEAVPAEGLRGGDVITLKGVNMELVTTVTFPGVADAVEPVSKGATEVKVEMPAAAISGDLLLNTASGTSVPVAIATQKPEFMSFANASLSLGSDVTIKGKYLDLVAKVIYTGGAEVEVAPASSTELTVAMPTTGSESGVLTLVMGNGETVETEELTINAPEFCYIPVLPGEDEELKGGEIFTIAVENGDKLTGVEVDGKTVQYLINNNTLVIAIPQMANAKTKVKLISSNGSIEYPIAFIPATEVKNEVWSGLTTITWNEGGRVIVPASAFKDVPAGAKMVLHYAQKDQVWAQAQINYGDFSGINFTEGDIKVNQTLVPTDVYGWFSDGILNRSTALVLTQEILDNIQANKGECEDVAEAGIIIQGSDLTFNSITLEWTVSMETTLWEGEAVADDWGNQPGILSDGGAELAAAEAKAGQTVHFYITPLSDAWKLQVLEGHWGPTYGSYCAVGEDTEGGKFTEYDLAGNGGKISIVLTQEMLDAAYTVGYWGNVFLLNGDDVKCTKVTIE